jgi:hypothetical protein
LFAVEWRTIEVEELTAMPKEGTLKIQCRNGTVTLTATNLSFRPRLGITSPTRWSVERDLVASVDVIHRSPLGWNLNIHTLDGRILRLDWVPANDAEPLVEALMGGQGILLAGNSALLDTSVPPRSTPTEPPNIYDYPYDTAATDEGAVPFDLAPLAPHPVGDTENWEPPLSEAQGTRAALAPVWQVLPPTEPSQASDSDPMPAHVGDDALSGEPTAPQSNFRHYAEQYAERAGAAAAVAKQWLTENGAQLAVFTKRTATQMAARARQAGERSIGRFQSLVRRDAASSSPAMLPTPPLAHTTSPTPQPTLLHRNYGAGLALFWRRLRAMPGKTQIGIGCGVLLLVLAFCSVISLSLAGGIGGNGAHSTPNTAREAFGNTPAAVATQAANATATASATTTPTPTTAPTATNTPTPSPTPIPTPQLTLSFTCARVVNKHSGEVCVQTQPGAALQIRVYYACNRTYATARSLQGTHDANASGGYIWLWSPYNSCTTGVIVATVTAEWQGQSLQESETFSWG